MFDIGLIFIIVILSSFIVGGIIELINDQKQKQRIKIQYETKGKSKKFVEFISYKIN